jgi:hypothetical protein
MRPGRRRDSFRSIRVMAENAPDGSGEPPDHELATWETIDSDGPHFGTASTLRAATESTLMWHIGRQVVLRGLRL